MYNKKEEKRVKIDENALINCLDSHKKKKNNNHYKFRIAILHHNVILKSREGLFEPDPAYFIGILKEYGFDIIFHGHTHEKNIRNFDGTLLIGAGTVSGNVVTRDPVNNINLVKIKFDSLPIFEDPLKIVCVKTFEFNYENPINPLKRLEWDCKLNDMSYEKYKELKKWLESNHKKINKDISKNRFYRALTSLVDSYSQIKDLDLINQTFYIESFKSHYRKKLESISDIKKAFYEIQSKFVKSWETVHDKDVSKKILMNLLFIPVQVFLDPELEYVDYFIEIISEIKYDPNLILIKSKLDLIEHFGAEKKFE